jgi:hypothetical protein
MGQEPDDGAVVVVPVPMDDFVARFRAPLPQAILSTPILRTTRPVRGREIHDEDLLPKRSARLAAKSKFREAKPEAQARKILMKKLGVEVETQEPDTASFDEFHTVFTSPLPVETRVAMQTYYLGKCCRPAEVTGVV